MNWLPQVYPPDHDDDDYSEGDRLIRLAELAYKTPEGGLISLDDWQKWLIRKVLVKRQGEFVHRHVVISMGRQNGKSVLGAIFALYGLLLHVPGPAVVSVASTVEQAQIVYRRLLWVIQENRELRRLFKKATETRGIELKDGSGIYRVMPSKASALQGHTVSMAVMDELHIMDQDTYNAIIIGAGQRKDSLVIGITTAGSDDSVLLKHLYERGKAGDIGFFLWEADEYCQMDDPEQLMKANPALAAGRMSLETALNEIRILPEPEARRYRLNQFVGASENPWVSQTQWWGCPRKQIPEGLPLVFSVDRTSEWQHASVCVTATDGVDTYTELVASLVKPKMEQIEKLLIALHDKHGSIGFAMDSSTMSSVGKRLRDKGYEVYLLTHNEMINACALAYSKVAEHRLHHDHQPLLSYQSPRAARKTLGDGWKIDRMNSVGDVDAVMATIAGVYVAEIKREDFMQIF